MSDETIKQSYWDNASSTKNILASAGAFMISFYLIKIAYHLITILRLYRSSQYCCSGNYLEKYGKWAVISGATDGIGLAFARELARRGHSIVVIGRNRTKLSAAKESLKNEPNVGEVNTIRIDLSNSSPENFEAIRDELDPENRNIGILINNAGIMPEQLKRFHHFELSYLQNLVNVNVLAPIYLTKMILPGMLKRERGLIINVSSVCGSIPSQFMGSYGATKSFIDAFSRQLQIEYYSHPIDIINLQPGGVVTKLLSNASAIVPEPSFYVPSAEFYAKSVLNAISTKISPFSGTLGHAITYQLVACDYPTWFQALIREFLMKRAGMKLELTPVMKRRGTGSFDLEA